MELAFQVPDPVGGAELTGDDGAGQHAVDGQQRGEDGVVGGMLRIGPAGQVGFDVRRHGSVQLRRAGEPAPGLRSPSAVGGSRFLPF